MSTTAVLGAGAGGAAATVELTAAGHDVHLWARSAATLEPFEAAGGVRYEGILGEGCTPARKLSSDLEQALCGADAVLVCLPTSAHRDVAIALAALGRLDVPVILNPGHTGGALEFQQAFVDSGVEPPPIAEFSTLTYVARKHSPERVTVSGRAKRIHVAALPGGDSAVAAARELYPRAIPARDVLATGLANVNMVLHPPGAVLGAAWVEATGGDFRFYVDAMTPGVARVMRQLDNERLAVARAFGHELPSVLQEMEGIGTVEQGMAAGDDLVEAIAGGKANAKIRAPESFAHRYYREDFGFGMVPFLALARIAGVQVPVAAALLSLAAAATGEDFAGSGRTAERMGIAGLDRDRLLAHVRAAA